MSERRDGWTKERLFVDCNHDGKVIGLAPATGQRHDLDMVCDFVGERGECHGDKEANAHRLAECWNAMLDIENPAAVIASWKACREALHVSLRIIDGLESQQAMYDDSHFSGVDMINKTVAAADALEGK